MPRRSRRDDWIEWRKCEGRQVVLDDLASGVLPLDADVVSAEEAWNEMYVAMPEFAGVPFSQFERRLADHRAQVRRVREASDGQVEAYHHDRDLYPRAAVNRKGEPVFDLSEAKVFLRHDVSNEVHETMPVEDMYYSRSAYHDHWDLDFFRRRLRQEIRRSKYMYYLEWKRAQKQQKRGQFPQDNPNDSEEEA